MSARLKTTLLVTVVLIAAVGAILWKTSSLLYEERVSFISDSSMKQIAPLKRLVGEQLNERKKDLVHFAATRAVNGAGRSRGFGEFEVIALVEPDANGQWNPAWIERGAEAKLDRWPQGYDLTLLKSIAYRKAKDGEVLWMRLSDAKGAAMFAAAVPVQLRAAAVSSDPAEASALPDSPAELVPMNSNSRRGVVVGFTSANPLVSSTEDFIGSTNEVYIVDERGYVASHVDKGFNGALFSEDSIVKEIQASQRLSGTGRFENFDGRSVIGHFEKIPESNLYAVITTPTTMLTGILDAYKKAAVFAAIAVGLLSLILAWIVGGTLTSAATPLFTAEEIARIGDDEIPDGWSETSTETPASLAPNLALEMSPAPASRSTGSVLANMNEERLKTERQNAFEAFQQDFATRLREPLLAILGQAQLIKIKSNDDGIAGHAASIEREARNAKDGLDQLQRLGKLETVQQTDEIADLEEVVSGALADKALELQNLGIRIETFTDPISSRGKTGELEKSLVHLIENSIEALRHRSEKKLTITVRASGEEAVIRVTDSGIGMTQEVIQHAFEPFFRGFDSPRHMGLGLAFVQMTTKRLGGHCSIQSSSGEGTTIEIRLPLVERAQVSEPVRSLAAAAPELPLLGGKAPLAPGEFEMMPAFFGEPENVYSQENANDSANHEMNDEPEEFTVHIRKPRPKGT